MNSAPCLVLCKKCKSTFWFADAPVRNGELVPVIGSIGEQVPQKLHECPGCGIVVACDTNGFGDVHMMESGIIKTFAALVGFAS